MSYTKQHGNYRNDVSDEEILKLYKDGNSLRRISEIVGLERHALKTRLKTLGIEIPTDETKNTTAFIFPLEDALQLHKQGLSCNAIAKKLNISAGKIVKKHLIAVGIEFEKAFNEPKKLDDKIKKIKELYERGFKYTDIAKVYDTSSNTIKAYLKKYGIVE